MFSIVAQQQEVTMSSLDFLSNYINPAREAAGEKEVEGKDFVNRICDELDLKKENFLLLSTGARGRKPLYTMLNYDQLMLVGMRESKAVRKSVLAKLKELSAPKEDPMVLLAKQVLKLDEENKRLAATKAQINDKRTATLMNKASQDAKKIKKLESQLQHIGEYKSIIAAELPQRVKTELNPKAQTWRVLQKLSKEMGFDYPKVDDPRYGSVCTYHVKVIERFKAEYLE